MSSLDIEGEETFFGEDINSPEDFIEDLCDRVNNGYNTVMDEDKKMSQLAYLIGFLTTLKARLNRVCERI